MNFRNAIVALLGSASLLRGVAGWSLSGRSVDATAVHAPVHTPAGRPAARLT